MGVVLTLRPGGGTLSIHGRAKICVHSSNSTRAAPRRRQCDVPHEPTRPNHPGRFKPWASASRSRWGTPRGDKGSHQLLHGFSLDEIFSGAAIRGYIRCQSPLWQTYATLLTKPRAGQRISRSVTFLAAVRAQRADDIELFPAVCDIDPPRFRAEERAKPRKASDTRSLSRGAPLAGPSAHAPGLGLAITGVPLRPCSRTRGTCPCCLCRCARGEPSGCSVKLVEAGAASRRQSAAHTPAGATPAPRPPAG